MSVSEPKEKTDYRNLALRRLAGRESSAHEMRAYLKRKGASEGEAEKVVSALVQAHSIDDQRNASAMARELVMRDKGPMQVVQKLRLKGVPLELSEATRLWNEASDRDEVVRARHVLER